MSSTPCRLRAPFLARATARLSAVWPPSVGRSASGRARTGRSLTATLLALWAWNEAEFLRTTEGNKQYSVRLADLVKRGDVSANVEMRPGDILIIPQSLF